MSKDGQYAWMSDQICVRLGSPSKKSICHPPYLVSAGKSDRRNHGHGETNEQDAK